MKKKNLFFACAALIAVSSCTSEINEEGFVDKANSISFNAYSNKSRALTTDITSDNMKDDQSGFGVVGYTHNDNKIYLYKGSNAAVQQKYVTSSNSWEYADKGDLKFWPKVNMDFYAYFPYSDNATFTATNTTGNVMTINTTCAHDVLFAYVADQEKTTRVPLNFYHAFAKIKELVIEMPTEGNLYKSHCQIEVQKVEFINTSTKGDVNVDYQGKATYTVSDPNATLNKTLESNVLVQSVTDKNSGTLISNGTSAAGYFFATNSTEVKNVIGTRKAMWDGDKANITNGTLSASELVCLKLTCKVWNGADDDKYYYVGGDSSFGEIYIPLKGNTDSDPSTSVTTFDAGKRYTYTIKMKDNVGYTDEGDPILTPILFTVSSVDSWDEVSVTITL